MEFRPIPVSEIDKEFRAFQEHLNRDLLRLYAIKPSKYLKVILEKADERLKGKCHKGVLSRVGVAFDEE